MIKFALIKERKTPPDRRVVFSPQKLKTVVQQYPEASFLVESSDLRIFPDSAYEEAGFEVTDDVSSCEVLLGVKEVPIEALIPGKKYFFFSHTIKQQPYNRNLLRAVLEKGIELYDHEVIVDEDGSRLIGFGRYAGIVGAYNGFRALGLRDEIYELRKVEQLADLQELLQELGKVKLPQMKIVLTGGGKVAHGAREILEHLRVTEVGVQEFLEKDFEYPVFCNLDVLDYNKRKDGKQGSVQNFYRYPEEYVSDFPRFARVSDMFIAGHFYGEGAPVFTSEEDMKAEDFRIRLVADISCDIAGPIASTIRASTIAEPFYGYHRFTGEEIDFKHPDAISVMAVDNLPCELPKDASEGFGDMFLQFVIPAFFNNDKDGILERARMTKDGKLTPKFSYLEKYINHEAAVK